MHSLTLNQDIQSLVHAWIEAEQQGQEFPVPFDVAWRLAEYATKASAKRKLPKAAQAGLFNKSVRKSGGRPVEDISLSVDGLKHLCLMADTEIGFAIRQYMIEAEKKWQLVRQQHPQIAQETEMLYLKAEIAKQEAIKAKAEENTLGLRHYVVTALPEHVQQKVLGYKEIVRTEVQTQIVQGDDIVNDGSTLTKTQLCHKLGMLSRKGKPDYKTLNQYLERLPKSSFRLSVRPVENQELYRDCLDDLERLIEQSERQQWLGE